MPAHGTSCPSTEGLAGERGGFLELPRSRHEPLLRLEWEPEKTKLIRDRLEMLTFDPAGRIFSFSSQGSIWRRGLDGRVLEISHTPVARSNMPACEFHEGRLASPEEGERWRLWVMGVLAEARERFGLHPALEAALGFDWRKDAEAFLAIYRPVGILPPDQYRSLVLQLTWGCAYNKCTFCDFFKKDSFRLKSPDEFRAHVQAALDWFGPSLRGRKGVFLGEANAVGIATADLLEALRVLREVLSAGPQTEPSRFARVCSFLDTFSTHRTVEEWRALREAGLDRLYLGVESGSTQVLKFLRKPGSADLTVDLVRDLKQAGLRAGPIVMTGVGGQEMAEDHLQQTADMLNRMPLGPEDRIYVSEFLTVPGSEYQRRAAEAGIHDLGRMGCREQSRALRSMLRFAPPPHGPAVALYDVRQFIY